MITTLDTQNWGKELQTGNAEFVETASNELYIVSNVRNNGFGFGRGFGNSFASPYQFVILKSDPVPPAPGPGSSFGALPPANAPVATYVFPQPTTSFDPVVTFDATTGLLHILGTRDTPTGTSTSSPQTSDLIKFTFDTQGLGGLQGPFLIAASVASRVRGAYDIGVLDTQNTIIAAALTDPAITMPPLQATITGISVNANLVTVNVMTMSTPFIQNQWVVIDDLLNATFLNGAVLLVESATPTSFTAIFQNVNYPLTSDTGSARAVGSSLFAVELDKSTNQPVAGTATIIASSPSRSGDTYDGVSLLVNGLSVDLYYQSHPKNITFKDQVFTINHVGRNSPATVGFGQSFGYSFGGFGQGGTPSTGFGYNFGFGFGLSQYGTWDEVPQVLTTFSARYTDGRLTVVQSADGTRYLSLTYWTQSNHPEGIVGNVFMGVQHGANPWFFHPTLGTIAGGSIIQSAVSCARNNAVNLTYLLQPFDLIENPDDRNDTAAWPLHVASVDPTTLGLTEVPGFYNTVNLTWLRGSKSLIDNNSLWALVGEREVAATPTELHIIPTVGAPSVLVDNSPSYFEDVGVTYAVSGLPLTLVDTNPQQGQYTIDLSIGLYEFSPADAGMTINISYKYISQIVPIYASLFNVPPIANVVPPTAVTWRNGTFYATDVAPVTSFSISAGVITVTANNDFTPGQKIAFYGFVKPENQFLNGNVVVVSTASSTQFTALFSSYFTDEAQGFGGDFGLMFSGSIHSLSGDTGFAAVLIPGLLPLSAAGSTDADEDALDYIWTENDPNLTDVFLTTSGANATVHVLGAVGSAQRVFDVGVTVIDLFPDLITQRHPALTISDVQVAAGVLTLTFSAPAGAIVPIAGEQIMLYDIVLGAPVAPTLNTVAGGSLPAQYAPGFGFQFGAGFGIYTPISVVITYVNALGETTGSINTVFTSVQGGAIPAGNLLEVISPVGAGGAGDATGYNVYVGLPGQETLQPNQAGLYFPTPLGTNWVENVNGFTSITTVPPTTSGASQEFLSDLVLTLTATTPTTLSANIGFGFGFDFGFDFGSAAFAQTAVTGFAISQFQFDTTVVTVPANVPPLAQFPAPQWEPGNVLAATVNRNTRIEITPTLSDPAWNPLAVYAAGQEVTYQGIGYEALPNSVSNHNKQPNISPTFWAAVKFPIVYSGLGDPDDVPTWQWAQVSGTTVPLPKGTTSSSLFIDTNGVNLNGEELEFSVTINDGINGPFSASFFINVAPYIFSSVNRDSLQLARSVYSSSATASNLTISNGIGSFTTTANTFTSGQRVWFEGMVGASFLNNNNFTILPTGFGQGFGIGFGAPSLTANFFQIYDPTLPNYGPASDSGIAYSPLPISQRNINAATSSWSPLDVSIMFNNLRTIKRNSVLDGTDRYLVISPYSVLVYGVFPAQGSVLLSRIFLPNSNLLILDAVHTEQDYTLVLDNAGNIYRYQIASFINTDNPDVTQPLSDFTSLSFSDTDLDNGEHIFTTVSFGNQRVIVVSGEQGAFMLQVNTTTLAVTGTFELTIASNFVYGANKVQFVRYVNMDSLTSGRILLGTILNNQALITNIAILNNALTVTANNSFNVGDMVILSGLTNATFLNGLTVKVIAQTSTTFEASLQAANYASTSDTGLAQDQSAGNTYETLIDLSQQQIIGTFDKSKLRNQFVQTGEIMFDPDDTYAGGPTAPTLNPITTTTLGGNTNIVLSWQMVRPDLITSYLIEIALVTNIGILVPDAAPYTFQVPANYQFTGDVGVFNTSVNAPMLSVSGDPVTMQYNVTSTGLYTFSSSQASNNVAISVRGAFNTFQVVNEGSVQQILASLPAGSKYYFRVQASGLDGTSGFSNIQSITL